MFIGGCAGSTGGGLKVSRVMILFKQIWREIVKTVHPRARKAMRHEGKVLEGSTLHGATSYFALFAVSFGCALLLISLDSFDFETNFTAVAACINNIGPGFGLVGPMGSFDCFSDLSTLVLSIAMLIGRLEIYPFLIAIMPGTWKNK
jgi:trk system potassium uptake protein TrkH